MNWRLSDMKVKEMESYKGTNKMGILNFMINMERNGFPCLSKYMPLLRKVIANIQDKSYIDSNNPSPEEAELLSAIDIAQMIHSEDIKNLIYIIDMKSLEYFNVVDLDDGQTNSIVVIRGELDFAALKECGVSDNNLNQSFIITFRDDDEKILVFGCNDENLRKNGSPNGYPGIDVFLEGMGEIIDDITNGCNVYELAKYNISKGMNMNRKGGSGNVYKVMLLIDGMLKDKCIEIDPIVIDDVIDADRGLYNTAIYRYDTDYVYYLKDGSGVFKSKFELKEGEPAKKFLDSVMEKDDDRNLVAIICTDIQRTDTMSMMTIYSTSENPSSDALNETFTMFRDDLEYMYSE